MITEKIYCCGCEKDVLAVLTSGQGIYPSADKDGQQKYWHLPFWKCEKCNNFVGCHHKTKDPTKPLGCIPTTEIRNARRHIHKLIDPLWQNHDEPFRARAWLYRWLAAKMGKKSYHTADIKTIEEARNIYVLVSKLKNVEDCRNEK